MAFYLVDYENVNIDGMQGIELLSSNDEVIIFYSEHADRLTFDLHQKIIATEAKVLYTKVGACKKNALDFQLVTYLGYLVALHPGAQFYIVSRDNGYKNVVNFWLEKQIELVQIGEINQVQAQSEVQVQTQENPWFRKVEKLFVDQETAALVAKCLQESHSKQELHNKIAAIFRSEDVGGYYKRVKHLL